MTNKSNHERVDKAISARKYLINDFFGGWIEEDIQLFRKYKYLTEPSENIITDYFGFKTPSHLVPWAQHLGGSLILEEPIPDDGIRAEAIEYYSVLTSLENSSSETFNIVELGASYAPWAAFGAALAIRLGINKIRAIAVEASPYFINEIYNIFKINNIPYGGVGTINQSITLKVINGAVSSVPGTLYFPVVTGYDQNGGQAVKSDQAVDYVGRSVSHEPVTAYTLEMITEDLPYIDMIHCDIQGAELDVLTSSIDLLKARVRSLFIGTHSRYIEGCLIHELHKKGFELIRERPCVFEYKKQLSDDVGMTTRDGGQYWINRNL